MVADDRAAAAGLSAQQQGRRTEERERLEELFSARQRRYTRRVEAFLRRAGKETPEEEDRHTRKRIANALEHLVVVTHYYVSVSFLSTPLCSYANAS